MSAKKYHVTLTPAEREQLQEIIGKGRQAVAKIRRAHLLLAADEAEAGLKMTDEQIRTQPWGKPLGWPWIMAISVQPVSRRVPNGAWRHILPPVGRPITAVGVAFSLTYPSHQPRQPAPRSKWPTSCGPRLVKPFTACGNVPLNRSSALSKKSWVSASFPYAGSRRPRANGGWSAWLLISNGCIPSGRPEASFRLPTA